MLAGRAHKKMRDRKAGRAESESSMANDHENAAPKPPPPAKRRTVSFNDDDDFKDNQKDDKKDTKKNRRPSMRSGHLTDTSTKEKLLENDAAIKTELERLESSDSQWRHPIGFGLLSALRILNAPFDPILSNTGYWIQPEDLEDIPAMFDSYLNVNCLYYSLVGVLAIETSLFLEIPPAEAPEYAKWLMTISRFCWATNGMWSLAAVVTSFHILWSMYVTPTWAKRRFLFDNSRTISIVYALGAPNFGIMLTGTITGVMGNIFIQEGFSTKDWVSAAMGLGLGGTVVLIFVLCSGSLINKTLRPWKIADDNLNERKRRFTDMTGRSVRNFLTTRSSLGDDFDESKSNDWRDWKEDPDGPLVFHDIDAAGFGPLDMPYVAHKLCDAGFTMEMLQRVNNDLLLDKLLEGAEIDKAGDRLRLILFIRDGVHVSTDNSLKMSYLGGGKIPPENESDLAFRNFEELIASASKADTIEKTCGQGKQ
ncbi:hypothetical protein ACHAXR_002489 [Thalassiosira sp. AJA248-18]